MAGRGDGDIIDINVAGEIGHGIRIHEIHDVDVVAHVFRIEKPHKGHLVGGTRGRKCHCFLRPVNGVAVLLKDSPLCRRRSTVHHVKDLGSHHGSLLTEEGEGGLVARTAEVESWGNEVGGFAAHVFQLAHHLHQLHDGGKVIVPTLADVEEVAEERTGVVHAPASGMMLAHDTGPHIRTGVGLRGPAIETVLKTGGVRVAVGDHDLGRNGAYKEAHQQYCTKKPTNCK